MEDPSILKINLCAIGEPSSLRTWSATPFNLLTELKKRDQCATAFDASYPKLIRMLLSLIALPFYGKYDLIRSPVRRYACAWKAAHQTGQSISNLTLHTSTLSLPFYKMPLSQRHYLYIDSSWKLISDYAITSKPYSPRLVVSADSLERTAYQQVAHIFSISHYVKDNLVNYYKISPDKVTVVGTGLGVIKPFYGEKNYKEKKILFVAKQSFYDKGGGLVIAGFKQACQIDPDLKLTIVGSGEAERYADHPNITVTGFVPLPELQSLFEESCLFLMPALYEPWGLVFLEAMACKMPIVGLNRNSFPELSGYGKHGFGIESADPAELAAILVDACNNPERLKSMGEKAQDFCLSQFSWKKTVAAILDSVSKENNETVART